MGMSLNIENDKYEFHGRAKDITKQKNALLAPYNKMVHNYGMELTLLPDEEQTSKINQNIGNARFVANHYLSDRDNLYKDKKEILSVSTYKKEFLPKLKKEFPFLELTDKFALEAAIEHVDNSFQRFYKHEGGFPKYKSASKPSGNKYTTKYTNGNIKLLANEAGLPCIQLPKIGAVRFVLPRGNTLETLLPPNTKILSVCVKKDAIAYYVSLQLETIVDLVKPFEEISYKDICSIDLGIKVFGVLGNNEEEEVIENPRWIKLHARRLRRFQKALSRKQYNKETHTGSKNWEKARRKVAKEQRKCANQRKDFQHKLSHKIAQKYKVFVCEDLNVKGMMKNHHLSKAIASVGWSSFLTKVQYKLEAKGGMLIKVGRFFPSSQTCSHCGYKNKDVKDLNIRAWVCPKCGTYHDRDANAKKNIYNEGVKLLREEYNIKIAA